MGDSEKLRRTLEILNWSADYLDSRGIEDARTAVEWMLTHVMHCSRADLYLNFDKPLTPEELSAYRPLLLRCASGQPVQQVIGKTEFYGLPFTVNGDVLIPRPETERLVDYILDHYRHSGKPALKVLDIGSGTGAIAAVLAVYMPNSRITALEYSGSAVKILRQNLRFHNLTERVRIIHADIFTWENDGGPFDLIVSNPPYISSREMEDLPQNVGYYEPAMALSGGGDGLDFYRYFAGQFHSLLKSGGMAVLEFGGSGQTPMLREIFSDYRDVEIHRDYQNDDRFVSFFRPDSV